MRTPAKTKYGTKSNNPVAYLAPPTKIALAEQVPSCQHYAGQQGKIQRVGYGAANDPAPCSKHSTGYDQRENSDHEPELGLHGPPHIHQRA
jgi:hypothetical protein